jgi:hypothetical protein
MSLGTILLIVLVIALLGGFSGFGGGPFYGTGYYGVGGLGLVLIMHLPQASRPFTDCRMLAVLPTPPVRLTATIEAIS